VAATLHRRSCTPASAPRIRTAFHAFDAFVSNADVDDYELEAIRAPALLVHAKDDPLVSYDAAERIPGARLIVSNRAATFMLGQTDLVRNQLAGFLAHPATA
jgi:pimeloyl-ACP methyl ester carboxylesterase